MHGISYKHEQSLKVKEIAPSWYATELYAACTI